MNFKGKMREKSGITLITLAVTIIILLILAGITIATITSDNGIIKNANDAKEQTEIAEEKEIVDRATIQAMGNNKRGNLVENELQEQLDKITGSGTTETDDVGEEFEVAFIESKRYYTVDKDGTVTGPQEIVEDKSPGDITKDKNGDDIEEGQPYEIWCVEDLVAFSNMANGSGIILENGKATEVNKSTSFSNKTVELKTDLNFKSKYSYANSERTDFGDINGNENDGNTLINEMTTGTGFTPIGNYTHTFSGIFLGNGFEINNIYENSASIAGLFGYVGNATISDLSISGKLISNEGSAGGIIAVNNNSSATVNIQNCSNNCNITAKLVADYNGAGGIVGGGNTSSSNLNIMNCYNQGKITIEKVTSSNNSIGAGGIIGNYRSHNILNIYNSYNIGEITSVSNAAGILGGTWAEGEINLLNCCNYGKISGTTIYNIANTTRYYGMR